MLRGQAFEQFPEAFVAGLKSGFFEGLSKTVRPLSSEELIPDCQSANNGVATIVRVDAGIGRGAWICLRSFRRERLAYLSQDGVSLSILEFR
jgi:hypothetical protein